MESLKYDRNNGLRHSSIKYYEMFIFAVLMFEFFVLHPGIQNMDESTVTLYFLSYQDLGFNARFLIGSIFKLFSEYISSSTLYYCICIIIICFNALVALILGKVLRKNREEGLSGLKVFIALLLVSPFSLSFLYDSWNFGCYDLYLIIFTVAIIIFARNKYLIWLLPLLSFAALATHQGWVFLYMPVMAVILIYECNKHKFAISKIAVSGITLLVVIISSLYFQFFTPGLPFDSPGDVISFLSRRTDYVLSAIPIMSNYFDSNHELFFELFKIVKSFAVPYSIFVLVATSPLIALFISLWIHAFKSAGNRFSKFIFFLCMAAPVAALPMFAFMDWDRWICAIFIGQFALVFYFLYEGVEGVAEAAEKAGAYFKKHLIVFVSIILFQAMILFSFSRPLFYFIQRQRDMVDFFYDTFEKYLMSTEQFRKP